MKTIKLQIKKSKKKAPCKRSDQIALWLFSLAHYGEKQILNYFSGIFECLAPIGFNWISYSHNFFGAKFMISLHNGSQIWCVCAD